jgi:hypothetical protein
MSGADAACFALKVLGLGLGIGLAVYVAVSVVMVGAFLLAVRVERWTMRRRGWDVR